MGREANIEMRRKARGYDRLRASNQRLLERVEAHERQLRGYERELDRKDEEIRRLQDQLHMLRTVVRRHQYQSGNRT